MPEQKFEEERKAKQSIRRKSRKSQSPRRQSRRKSSRRQSRRRSSRRASKSSRRRTIRLHDPPQVLWDEEELAINDVVNYLQGEPLGLSPIDLELSTMRKTTMLPTLRWLNTENRPFAMKIANTGTTATVSGLWLSNDCTKLTGGPLKEEYDFSQFHFHWGEDERDGSEHLVSHNHYPLEVHVVFHKSSYGKHERARREPDGLVVVVYFYTISKSPNPTLEPLLSAVEAISSSMTEKYIDPFKYSTVFPVFTEDYILYNGMMKWKCNHAVMWFICRETLGINRNQLGTFRRIIGIQGQAILKNYRDVQETGETKVFIAYPSPLDIDVVLHPRPMTPDTPPPSERKKDKKSSTKYAPRKSTVRRQSKRQSKTGKGRQSKVAAKRASKSPAKRQSMKRKSKMK